MITDKFDLTKQILETNMSARGDGHGKFLNIVCRVLYGLNHPDFEEFNVESWTRSRRKVMEEYPRLDNRTSTTKKAQRAMKAAIKETI